MNISGSKELCPAWGQNEIEGQSWIDLFLIIWKQYCVIIENNSIRMNLSEAQPSD